MLNGLPVMDGYDPFLPQTRHTQLLTARDSNDLVFIKRLGQLFAIKYEASLPDADHSAPTLDIARDSIVVTEKDDVPPRARIIETVETVNDGPLALERVLATDFDPSSTLVLEELPNPPDVTGSAQAATQVSTEPHARDEQSGNSDALLESSPEQVHWNVDEPEYLKLEVKSPRPTWLLVSDAYWPAWRAWVNGSEVVIRRANFYFRAVQIPAGDSVVEMRYVERLAWLGPSVSFMTCLIVVSLLAVSCRKRAIAPVL
jgi:hypothetical protein